MPLLKKDEFGKTNWMEPSPSTADDETATGAILYFNAAEKSKSLDQILRQWQQHPPTPLPIKTKLQYSIN